jgi:hypothetical protein
MRKIEEERKREREEMGRHWERDRERKEGMIKSRLKRQVEIRRRYI